MKDERLLSLDLMRGLIMVLLALEGTGLYWRLSDLAGSGAFQQFMLQFEHHEWHGLHFWDLIQPGFMFIAGTALAFSLFRQAGQGVFWRQSLGKALRRSGWLFFWGVLDYAVRKSGLSFELWDVLTQLSFTLLVAFLIYRFPVIWQLLVSLALLLLTELLYRFMEVPNFSQPFTDQQNFGNYVDLLLMNKINSGGWVAINCLPTAAHTIWGMMAGKLLLSDKSHQLKLKSLVIAGLCCLACGYAMDLGQLTPIIKKIATSSFVLVSGGWCLLLLAALYWWVDVRNHKRYLQFFLIIGMNSLFIYLFFEIVGSRWFNGYVFALTGGLMSKIGFEGGQAEIVSCLCIFALEWGICYFLYKKRIFFRA